MGTHRDFLKELEEKSGGSFLIENQNGRALLRVYPAGKNGRAVKISDVQARLDLFGITPDDIDFVKELVHSADGESHDIGAWHEPGAVDAVVGVEISDDAMEAWIQITPPQMGGRWPSKADMLLKLQEQSVIFGIDNDALDKHAVDPTTLFSPEEQLNRVPRKIKYLAAKGEWPTSGEGGEIQHRFNPTPGLAPQTSKRDGVYPERIDFRNLNVIQTCNTGDTLATVFPPVQGAAGRTVKGELIAASLLFDARLEAGKNCILTDQGQTLKATIAGHVRIEGHSPLQRARIDVEPLLELENVDFSTGHIQFPGTVFIKGTVADGFRVEADGNIQIELAVSHVQLKAKGDLILAGGIASRGEGTLSAGGDIYARFIEGAKIRTDSSVFVEEAIMHSRIYAGKHIVLQGGRGELIGGEALAGLTLIANHIGARIGTPTKVTVGLDPETMEKLKAMDEELEEKRNTLNRIETHSKQLEESMRRNKHREEGEEETRNKLQILNDKLSRMVRLLMQQKEKIYFGLTPDPQAKAEALEAIHPGVEILFGTGNRKYRVEHKPVLGYSRVIIEDNKAVCYHF